MYSIEFTRTATKQLERLPKNVQTLVIRKLERLASDPLNAAEVKALKGDGEAAYRLRVGDYRVLFNIHQNRLIIVVVKVSHRKEAYR